MLRSYYTLKENITLYAEKTFQSMVPCFFVFGAIMEHMILITSSMCYSSISRNGYYLHNEEIPHAGALTEQSDLYSPN